MNRLEQLFQNKKENQTILNVYFTAGYPNLEDTIPILKRLEESGTDIIELGIPFSDPLADGATIQQSSEKALANGMTIEKLFTQLEGFRKTQNIPVIMMGYLNPIMQFGLEAFLKRASEVGVDGFIFPDVPPYEFENEWKALMEQYNLTFSFLVTPETSSDRIRYLDSLSSGFLYAVSSSSTTGNSKKVDNAEESMKEYLNALKSMGLKNPILAGFGIKTHADYMKVNELVDGAIIGSAFIKHLGKHGSTDESVKGFVDGVKKG